ncbi:MAG: hypothetical protein WDM89_00950 [Rhizomicrobium sp.]
MFNNDWGVMVEAPLTHRGFLTADSGTPEEFDHTSLGDVRVMANYTGFSSDMSTGIIAGLKLPTGDSTYRNFDSDVEIGSGSTDLLLGAYHTGSISKDGNWNYYAQIMWQHEMATQHHYTPAANSTARSAYRGPAGPLATRRSHPCFSSSLPIADATAVWPATRATPLRAPVDLARHQGRFRNLVDVC